MQLCVSRLQAGCVGREGRDFSRALPEICANVSSYSAGRRRENITGGARLLVVPLWPLFRFVIPRNFGSEESALQLLLIENRAFLAGSRPLGTMREEDLSARLKPCPSQNLRGCESWVSGAGGDCGKGTHSCVPLRFEIRFRADQAQLQRLKPSSLPTFRYG